MPTTLTLVPSGGGPVTVVELHISDRATRHALALAFLRDPSPAEVLDLQVLAVGIAWPNPAPWAAIEADEVARLEGDVRGDEVYLRLQGLSADDRRSGAATLAAHRAELAKARAALDAARVVLGSEARLRSDVERIMSALGGCPPIAVYQAGDALLAEAISDITSGHAAYLEAVARGFSPAPAGTSSPGASDSLVSGGVTPSSG